MRVLLLVCFLLLLNCEDKKSETKKVAKPTIETTSNTEKKDSVPYTTEREFPKLDNKNAIVVHDRELYC